MADRKLPGIELDQMLRSIQRDQAGLDSMLSASHLADQALASDAFLRGTVSLDSLVGGWRNELLEFQNLAQVSVADAMAAAAASSSLAALSVARLPEIEVQNLGSAISESLSQYLTGVGREATASLAAALQPTAMAATSGLLALLGRHDELERKADEALFQMGWWYPPSGDSQAFGEIGRLALDGKKVAVRRAMVELGRSRQMRRIVNGWTDLEPFRQRARFLRDGLRDHGDERFRVSVPLLLAAIEGIVIDVYDPGSILTSPRPLMPAVAASDAVVGPAAADVVTMLWSKQDFSAVATGTRQLNRHLIMHGRSTGYGTGENSTKVVFALDLLAWLVERRLGGEQ